MACSFLLRVVYDPSIWTSFGYTVQRYIASSVTVAVPVFAIIFGIGFIAKVFHWMTK